MAVSLTTLVIHFDVLVREEEAHDGLVELVGHLDVQRDHVHFEVLLHRNPTNCKRDTLHHAMDQTPKCDSLHYAMDQTPKCDSLHHAMDQMPKCDSLHYAMDQMPKH